MDSVGRGICNFQDICMICCYNSDLSLPLALCGLGGWLLVWFSFSPANVKIYFVILRNLVWLVEIDSKAKLKDHPAEPTVCCRAKPSLTGPANGKKCMTRGLVPSWSLGEAEMTDATAFFQTPIPTLLVHHVKWVCKNRAENKNSLEGLPAGWCAAVPAGAWAAWSGLAWPHIPSVPLHWGMQQQGTCSQPASNAEESEKIRNVALETEALQTSMPWERGRQSCCS